VRDGKKVANVPTDVLNSKVEYDHAESGWGGWVEGSYYNSYFLNNNNTFGIPSYMIGNVNIHKNVELKNSWFRFAKFYLEIDNIGDKKYADKPLPRKPSSPATAGRSTAASRWDCSRSMPFDGVAMRRLRRMDDCGSCSRGNTLFKQRRNL